MSAVGSFAMSGASRWLAAPAGSAGTIPNAATAATQRGLPIFIRVSPGSMFGMPPRGGEGAGACVFGVAGVARIARGPPRLDVGACERDRCAEIARISPERRAQRGRFTPPSVAHGDRQSLQHFAAIDRDPRRSDRRRSGNDDRNTDRRKPAARPRIHPTNLTSKARSTNHDAASAATAIEPATNTSLR